MNIGGLKEAGWKKENLVLMASVGAGFTVGAALFFTAVPCLRCVNGVLGPTP